MTHQSAQAAGGQTPGSEGKRRKRKPGSLVAYLYISPWLIGFIVLTLVPFVASFIYSFTDYNMVREQSFVGLANYIEIFTKDPVFVQSLRVTLLYVVIAVPLKLIVALLVAMLLNVKMRGISIYRTIYYLPSILGGSVAVSVLWRFMFMREGLVNEMLSYFSLPPVNWLGDPNLALFTITLLPVWEFGSSMVLFLAGLKQVPAELYEASKVDGASRARTFFSVTLPLLTPIVLFNLIMQMINAFQQFTAAFVITDGGPMKSTYLYGMMLYDNAFQFFKMGYASAQSWILFLIILVFTFVLFKTSNRWAHYEDGGDGK
ncbi:ABC transporter permease [Paenibacillus sp. MY03]|jgi:oligogalacturonide transport system permease protein|uniref:carbohydrate ABC transporter permease n=1 Tax=Paenibacillus TaxID=44249 RepID=UPI000B3D1582|nr:MULTISPECIES: sugar ABC transporter permease [Paenibacillus]OUS68329.1 ABC transporter permease [Paenibacillus sp. MY03]